MSDETTEVQVQDSVAADEVVAMGDFSPGVKQVGDLIISKEEDAKAKNFRIGKATYTNLVKGQKSLGDKWEEKDFDRFSKNVGEYVRSKSQISSVPRIDDFVRAHLFVECAKKAGLAKVELLSYNAIAEHLSRGPVMAFSKKTLVAEIRDDYAVKVAEWIDNLTGAEPMNRDKLKTAIALHAKDLSDAKLAKLDPDALLAQQAKAAATAKRTEGNKASADMTEAVDTLVRNDHFSPAMIQSLVEKAIVDAGGKVPAPPVIKAGYDPAAMTVEDVKKFATELAMGQKTLDVAKAMVESLGKIIAYIENQGTKVAA